MGEVLISLIIPTRGRPEQMVGCLESIHANASVPDDIEIIVVVDEDDHASQAVAFDPLTLVKVIVPPGLTMGALNTAGFRASRGRYIMLMNDDVIVRTEGWDTKTLAVFRSFPDEIVLVHVNDLIFNDRLCTFPFVSRRFCDFANGISSDQYIRYRIDDHIYHVFNLLSLLGMNRILYLPDVIFEHRNVVVNSEGKEEYVPDPRIHALDTAFFDEMMPLRKDLAVRLLSWIDGYKRSQVEAIRRKILASHNDAAELRRPEYVRSMAEGKPALDVRVTIGFVSADSNSKHSRTALELLKKNTTNFDLVVLDNNRGPGFNHPREMNRLLDICRTDYLVLMDDDVWVGPGWLQSLLSCINPEVGLVTPLHKDTNGQLSYAGLVMHPDQSGHHSHVLEIQANPTPAQTICSAVMLIDMGKVGHIRVDESYSKYFLDIDYGLRIWEAGFKVLIDSGCSCTHLAGGTLTQGSKLSVRLFDAQRQHWVRDWIETGRFARLKENAWKSIPSLQDIYGDKSLLTRVVFNSRGYDVYSMGSKYYELPTGLPVPSRGALEMGTLPNVVVTSSIQQTRVYTTVFSLLPPVIEREIGKLFCTLGLLRLGSRLWNSATSRIESKLPPRS